MKETKKSVKKNKPSPSKKVTEFEKALGSMPAAEKVVPITIDGETYELHIKPYLDFETKAGLMVNLRQMYFGNGDFDRHYGDAVLEFVLFQLYTGLTFGGDINLFDAFIHSDYAVHDVAFRDAYYSEDYAAVRTAVEGNLDAMLKEVQMPLYQELFYKNCNDTCEMLRDLLENASDSLSQMADSVQGETGTSVKDLLDALQQMNQKDEKKLVDAVLSFQEAKAKRVAKPFVAQYE